MDPNLPDNEGWAAIHNVAMKGDLEIIKFLIENAKVPIDQRIVGLHSNVDLTTAIDIALSRGHSEMAEYLLEKGASLAAGFDSKRLRSCTNNALTAIFKGASEHDLENPKVWLERAHAHGLVPTVFILKKVIQSVAEYHLEDERFQGWSNFYFGFLADNIAIDEGDLDIFEEDDWSEILIDALDYAPETISEAVTTFTKKGIDVGSDLL